MHKHKYECTNAEIRIHMICASSSHLGVTVRRMSVSPVQKKKIIKKKMLKSYKEINKQITEHI